MSVVVPSNGVFRHLAGCSSEKPGTNPQLTRVTKKERRMLGEKGANAGDVHTEIKVQPALLTSSIVSTST